MISGRDTRAVVTTLGASVATDISMTFTGTDVGVGGMVGLGVDGGVDHIDPRGWDGLVAEASGTMVDTTADVFATVHTIEVGGVGGGVVERPAVCVVTVRVRHPGTTVTSSSRGGATTAGIFCGGDSLDAGAGSLDSTSMASDDHRNVSCKRVYEACLLNSLHTTLRAFEISDSPRRVTGPSKRSATSQRSRAFPLTCIPSGVNRIISMPAFLFLRTPMTVGFLVSRSMTRMSGATPSSQAFDACF